MLLLVRRLLVLVFLAVAIESAAQGELRMANDLHGLGRESDLRKIPVVLFFSRQSIPHATFTEQRVIELVPTIQFTDGVGDILVEDIVGVTTLGFYGAYLEQAIEQSLNILRLRN